MNSWFRIGTNMHAPTPTPNPSLHAISFFSPPKNCENQFGQWGSSPPNVGNAQKKGCFVLGDLILPWSVQFHKWRRTPRRESGTSTWKPGPPRRCRRAMAGSRGCSKGRRWRERGRWGRLGWASSRPGNDPSRSRWQCPEQSWPVQTHSWQKNHLVMLISCQCELLLWSVGKQIYLSWVHMRLLLVSEMVPPMPHKRLQVHVTWQMNIYDVQCSPSTNACGDKRGEK